MLKGHFLIFNIPGAIFNIPGTQGVIFCRLILPNMWISYKNMYTFLKPMGAWAPRGPHIPPPLHTSLESSVSCHFHSGFQPDRLLNYI